VLSRLSLPQKVALCVPARPSKNALFARFSNWRAALPETPLSSRAGREANCMSAERFTLDTNIPLLCLPPNASLTAY
jgi:hypothetical protein